jgi:tetratricopeptide (TPR) repeat protein
MILGVTYGLARAYVGAGQREQADTTLASLATAAVSSAETLFKMGLRAVEIRDLPLAERIFRVAVQRSPGLATAHEHLGVVFGMEGKDADAAGQFEQAVGLDPSSATAHFHLAVAYAQLQRFAEARAHAEEAVRLNPADGAARGLLRRLTGST